jgi:hypothetical protein
VNILILLVTITLLVIGGVLIVKMKKHPPVVYHNRNAQRSEHIYDHVIDNTPSKRPNTGTITYQDLDVSKMEGEHVYDSTKNK